MTRPIRILIIVALSVAIAMGSFYLYEKFYKSWAEERATSKALEEWRKDHPIPQDKSLQGSIDRLE
jgi:hypothetical protein